MAEGFAAAKSSLALTRDLAQSAAEIDVPHLLTGLLREARLGSKPLLRTVIEKGWRIEQAAAPTHFAALNAMTYVATHHESLDPNEWYRPTPLQAAVLARRAGAFVTHRGQRCAHCNRTLQPN